MKQVLITLAAQNAPGNFFKKKIIQIEDWTLAQWHHVEAKVNTVLFCWQFSKGTIKGFKLLFNGSDWSDMMRSWQRESHMGSGIGNTIYSLNWPRV